MSMAKSPTFSRLREMAKVMATQDGLLNDLLTWERLTPELRSRYKLMAYVGLANARYTTRSQIDKVLKRYPRLKEEHIRQIWKDMVDDILEEGK